MCCGCPLRLATLIIGISQNFISTIGVFGLLNINRIADPESRKIIEIAIGCLCVYIVLNFSLIYGAAKSVRWFLIPWILGYGIASLAATVFCIIDYSVRYIMAICALLGWYQCISVIYYYRELLQTKISEQMKQGDGIVTSTIQETTVIVVHDKSQQTA